MTTTLRVSECHFFMKRHFLNRSTRECERLKWNCVEPFKYGLKIARLLIYCWLISIYSARSRLKQFLTLNYFLKGKWVHVVHVFVYIFHAWSSLLILVFFNFLGKQDAKLQLSFHWNFISGPLIFSCDLDLVNCIESTTSQLKMRFAPLSMSWSSYYNSNFFGFQSASTSMGSKIATLCEKTGQFPRNRFISLGNALQRQTIWRWFEATDPSIMGASIQTRLALNARASI